MGLSVPRNELLAIIKEFNTLEITEKIYTKGVEEVELLLIFLEAIECIQEGSEEEDMLSQKLIKYYNKMAKQVEALDQKAVVKATEELPSIEKKSKQVKAVEDFVEKVTEVPTKTKMVQITDIMDKMDEDSAKNVFGMKVKGRVHRIIKPLLSGKSESFLIKKNYVEDVHEIETAIMELKKKMKDNLEVTVAQDDNGKVYHKFFVTREYYKSL